MYTMNHQISFHINPIATYNYSGCTFFAILGRVGYWLPVAVRGCVVSVAVTMVSMGL